MSLSPSAKAISSASDKESGPLSLSVEKIYPEKTEDHSASIAKNDSDSSNTIAIPTNVSSNPFPSSDNSSQEYHLKWVKWQGSQSKLPIVTQNSNGSCPLLAIINVLLLRKNITFPPIIEMVTASQLMDYLCDCILNYVPKNLPEQIKLNYEQNLQDAMSIMPRLQTGLDVNVKFTGIMDFEYTPECIIFDLLRIPLYHGWLVDSDQREICRIISNQSYNQLVDKIIASKTSNSDKSEMFLAEEFLNQTASQLTNYGLSQLIKHIKDEEPCILFRNNHFITLYKHKGKLFQLVTDQGFLTESNVVWESLDNIEGDTYFVDGDFVLVPPKPSSSLHSSTIANTQQQIDQELVI
ncbi:DUF544 domain containing protein [Sarcoptes scabiei]|uniref:Ubiquitin carboxyl-terminal hydrolase n=1 Tax=Sarcoptes scabiei TaxID=52283 RepID=A0A132AKD9_SARSC|nr:DUF544 domain containing protein [Sarcoptes scabiei]